MTEEIESAKETNLLTTTEHKGPIYFNITEENPINWQIYVEVC